MLKDHEQNNAQEVIKEGTYRPKREAAKLGEVWMRYAQGRNWREGSGKYSDTNLI